MKQEQDTGRLLYVEGRHLTFEDGKVYERKVVFVAPGSTIYKIDGQNYVKDLDSRNARTLVPVSRQHSDETLRSYGFTIEEKTINDGNEAPKDVINGGTFREGLCYIKNYNGALYGDERDLIKPFSTLDSEKMEGWPKGFGAMLIHEDGTIDACVYHSMAYRSLLCHAAFDMIMCRDELKMWPREKWIEYPNYALIPSDSEHPKYKHVVSEMLKLNGIEADQFATIAAAKESPYPYGGARVAGFVPNVMLK